MVDKTDGRKPQSDDAVLEKWRALYDAADDVYRVAPWDYFYDTDLTEIHLPDSEETYYCSVSGMYDGFKAVSVYTGNAGLIDLINYLNSLDMPEYVSMGYKNCLECTWSARKEQKKRDMDIIKALERKYRGAEAWPLFREHSIGLEPWYLTEEEVELLSDVLVQFAAAVGEMAADGEFDCIADGERVRRRFDEESGEWVNEWASPMEKVEAVADGCIITDELLIRRLKMRESTDATLEFDMPYVPFVISRGRGHAERDYYPQMSIMCDTDRMSVEYRHFLEEDDNPNDVALGMMINYIESKGRPSVVYVRNSKLFGALAHLCSSVDVEIFLTPTLHVLDYFVQDFILSYQSL